MALGWLSDGLAYFSSSSTLEPASATSGTADAAIMVSKTTVLSERHILFFL